MDISAHHIDQPHILLATSVGVCPQLEAGSRSGIIGVTCSRKRKRFRSRLDLRAAQRSNQTRIQQRNSSAPSTGAVWHLRKGIYRRKNRASWEVSINNGAGQRHLGTCRSEEEALRIYQRVAIKIGHPDARRFCISNPYENRFLLLHEAPKEQLLEVIPGEDSLILSPSSSSERTPSEHSRPKLRRLSDRIQDPSPDLPDSTAVSQLGWLPDTGMDGEGAFAADWISSSQLNAATRYAPSDMDNPQVINPWLPVISEQEPSPLQPYSLPVDTVQPFELPLGTAEALPFGTMQPYNSMQHGPSSLEVSAATLHQPSPYASYSQQADFPQQADASCQISVSQLSPPLSAVQIDTVGADKSSSTVKAPVTSRHELEQHPALDSPQLETTACSTAQYWGNKQHSQQDTPVFSDAELLELFMGPADDSYGPIIGDFGEYSSTTSANIESHERASVRSQSQARAMFITCPKQPSEEYLLYH